MRNYEAEERYYSRIASSVVSDIKVGGLPEGSDDLGYSFETSCGYKIMVARLHEIMKSLPENRQSFFRLGVTAHEVLHPYFTDFLASKGLSEIEHLVFNMVEDIRIEYFAPTIIGGVLLDALEYTIGYIFETTSPISSADDPLQQVIKAMIMAGDMGYIKGGFTNDASEKCFNEVFPLMQEGASSPKCKVAITKAKEIVVIMRKYFDLSSLEKILKALNRSKRPEGNTRGHDADASGVDQSEKAIKRAQLSKKCQSKMSGSDVQDCDDIEDGGDDGDNEPENDFGDAIDHVNEGIENERKADEKGEQGCHPLHPSVCGGLHVDNVASEPGDRDFSHCTRQIKALESEIRNIMMQNKTTKEKTTSGRFNVGRFVGMSEYCFDKKITREDNDVCVMIVCDNSGSMSGIKIAKAIDSTYVLTSAFANLGIPVYAFSFKYDHTPVHNHAVRWNASPKSRRSIGSWEAGGGNLDNIAIKAATEMLERRPEKNKLLIVISDGAPCSYGGDNDAIELTKKEIANAQRKFDVIGVYIEQEDTKEIHYMYGDSFCWVKDIAALPKVIGAKVKIFAKKW